MFDKLNKSIIESLATARGGLIRVPAALAAAVDAEGSRDELPRFAAAALELPEEPAKESEQPVKVPTDGPPDTPSIMAARLASVETKVVAARVRRRVRGAQRPAA